MRDFRLDSYNVNFNDFFTVIISTITFQCLEDVIYHSTLIIQGAEDFKVCWIENTKNILPIYKSNWFQLASLVKNMQV